MHKEDILLPVEKCLTHFIWTLAKYQHVKYKPHKIKDEIQFSVLFLNMDTMFRNHNIKVCLLDPTTNLKSKFITSYSFF